MIRIRRARGSDWAAIDDMVEQVMAASAPHPSARDTWWIAPGAAAAAARLWDLERAAILTRCVVLPEYRGQGLQRRMIAARCAWARARGCAEVWTYTAAWNTHSANNLIRAGFALWVPEHWGGARADTDRWLYWRRAL